MTNEPKTNLKAIYLNYGLFLGLFLILYTLVAYIIGIDKEVWVGYSVYLIYFIAIIYVVYQTKNQNKGFLLFSDALKVSFYTFLIASLISTAYLIVHIHFIDTHFIEGIQEMQRAKMLKDGIPQASVDKAMEVAATFQKPAIFISLGWVSQIVIGSILSLIAAFMLKSHK